MALAIDVSSPAVVSTTTGPTPTSGSFTPPAGAVLLVAFSGDSASPANPGAPTITDNLGTHLTYNLIGWRSRADGSPAVDGQAAMWWAVVGSSVSMTVGVTNNAGAGSRAGALKVWVLTGADTAGVGASGKVASASAASIAQSYTAQATGGQGFICDADWDNKTAQSAGAGCTSDGSAQVGTALTYGFMRRTTADDSSGVSNSLSLTLPATSTALSWVYAEVKPATAGGASIAPDGISVPVTLGSPTLTWSATVAPDGIAVPVVLGDPTVGASSVAPDGIAVPVTLGAPALSWTGSIAPDGIAVPVALGAPIVGAVAVNPDGVSVPVVLGDPALSWSAAAAPDGIGVPVTLGSPTLTLSGIAPDGISVPVALGSPVLAWSGTVSPDGISVPVALGAPGVNMPGTIVIRPNTGTTTRPSTGTITRPNSGIVTRP